MKPKNSSICIILCLISCVQCLHELCAKRPPQNIDCTTQLFGEDSDNTNLCNVKYFVTNSSTCAAFSFHFQHKSKRYTYLGDVLLKPFFWTYNNEYSYNYTLFNITFSNIQWERLRFRFQSYYDDYKNHCREIFVYQRSPSANLSSLNYDCHWSDQFLRYQNETFFLDYEAESSTAMAHGKYAFVVPAAQSLLFQAAKPWIPFVYLNITDPEYVYIHIVPPNNYLGEQIYEVKVCLQFVKCTEHIVNGESGQEVVHVHQIETTGMYSFDITALNQTCFKEICDSVEGPILYFDLIHENISYSVLTNALIFSIIWIFIVMWWTCTGKRKKLHPEVLLIHPTGNKRDVELINLVGQYLQSELNWNLMWEKDIKLTQHGDPYIWCLEAFSKADCVIYVTANDPTKNEPHNDTEAVNIHRDIDRILLKFVKSGIHKNKSFVNVTFDHHKMPQVPIELKHMRTFHLMSEWYPLLYYVMNYGMWSKRLHPIIPLENSHLGNKLLNALSSKEI